MMDTRQRFRQELTEKQHKVFRDLERQEASLNRALRDEVVGDVMKHFPWVFFASPDAEYLVEYIYKAQLDVKRFCLVRGSMMIPKTKKSHVRSLVFDLFVYRLI